MTEKTSRTTATGIQSHFGAQPVASAERQGMVNQVFDKVADRYDLMNDLMSAGLHRLWKDALVAWLAPPRTGRRFNVLDVAGGTGDIADRIVAAGGAGTRVTICDINPAMIEQGRRRGGAAACEGRLGYAAGNAESLPFADCSFDAYTVAFGIRNVTAIDHALDEAYRVLRPGGRFVCMEFSSVQIPGLDVAYEAFANTVVPALGKAVTGDGTAYRYLIESIARFPNQKVFMRMIARSGFERVQFRNLTGGIVALHSAWRL